MHRTEANVLKAATAKNTPLNAVRVGGTARVSVLALERDTKLTAWVVSLGSLVVFFSSSCVSRRIEGFPSRF